MKLIGLARLGRDGDTRYSNSGDAILDLSLAFDYRIKGEKQTQWVKAAMFGERAEKVSQYMTKGKLLYVEISDVHVHTWEKDGQTKFALQGVLSHFEFAGGPRDDQQRSEPPRQTQQRQAPSDGVDDDVPF